MADITMCVNKKCPLRMKCHRYTAVPTPYYQSFADYKPVNGKCDGFWDNKGLCSRFNIKDEQMKQIAESKWIGRLCWFWDEPNEDNKIIGILDYIDHEAFYCYHANQHDELWYKYCRPVLPNEVKFVEGTEC